MYHLTIIHIEAVVCQASFDSVEELNFFTDFYRLKYSHWYYDIKVLGEGSTYRVYKFIKKDH